jgi:hypothetical protein
VLRLRLPVVTRVLVNTFRKTGWDIAAQQVSCKALGPELLNIPAQQQHADRVPQDDTLETLTSWRFAPICLEFRKGEFVLRE